MTAGLVTLLFYITIYAITRVAALPRGARTTTAVAGDNDIVATMPVLPQPLPFPLIPQHIKSVLFNHTLAPPHCLCTLCTPSCFRAPRAEWADMLFWSRSWFMPPRLIAHITYRTLFIYAHRGPTPTSPSAGAVSVWVNRMRSQRAFEKHLRHYTDVNAPHCATTRLPLTRMPLAHGYQTPVALCFQLRLPAHMPALPHLLRGEEGRACLVPSQPYSNLPTACCLLWFFPACSGAVCHCCLPLRVVPFPRYCGLDDALALQTGGGTCFLPSPLRFVWAVASGHCVVFPDPSHFCPVTIVVASNQLIITHLHTSACMLRYLP